MQITRELQKGFLLLSIWTSMHLYEFSNRRNFAEAAEGVTGFASEDFDQQAIEGNTDSPEGPPSTTYRNKAVTSILMPPVEYIRSPTPVQNYRPGEKRASSFETGTKTYTPLNQKSLSTCRYIFTVNSSPQCKGSEGANTHSTIMITRAQLNDYITRLGRLEEAIFGSMNRAEPITRDDISKDPDESISSTRDSNQTVDNSAMTLETITSQMREQFKNLEGKVEESEKNTKDLEEDKERLMLALKKSTTAQINLMVVKKAVEKSLQKIKNENARLLRLNRNLTAENTNLNVRKKTLEKVRDAFRQRNRKLELEKAHSIREGEGCKKENRLLLNDNSFLRIRVGNLTEVVERYIKQSQNEEALHYELENEKEKNEVLIGENVKLKNRLKTANASIAELEKRIPEILKIPAYDEAEHIQEESFTTEEHLVTSDVRTTPYTTTTVNNSSSRKANDFAYCGKIVSVIGPETIRESRSFLERYGVWMTDPLELLGEGKVWAIDTIREKVKELKQFSNLRKFIMDQPEKVIMLPVPVESTGGLIYNGSFYYQRRNSRKLVRYEIKSKTVLKERPVHHAGFHGMYAYLWGGFTDIDLAVDEYGLWVIYSTRQNKGNIVISKLNPVTLRTSSTIKTSIPKRQVANAFMVCGVLYTVDSYNAPNASLNYAYDTSTRRLKRISIPFINEYRYNVMIDYNPRTREIFSWDNSHQVKYYAKLDKSLGRIQKNSNGVDSITA